MQIRDKALFTHLRLNWLDNPSLLVKPWQVEDYRQLNILELFKRLKALGIPLSEEALKVYAETNDTPEDLAECLWIHEDDENGYHQAFLLLFELWRRLLPEKQSLSIFCDELDHRIELYDKDLLENEESLQEGIQQLEDILDQNADQGEEPQVVFASLSQYLAHDVEAFLYDYILENIEQENELYGSELLDGFYEYIGRKKWFDFLRIQLFAKSDVDEANHMLQRLLEELQEEPDFQLLIEMCLFLVHTGDPQLFTQAAEQACKLIQKEKDFHDLLSIVADFYRRMDKESIFHRLNMLLKKRKAKDPEDIVNPKDKEIAEFLLFLQNADWSEV